MHVTHRTNISELPMVYYLPLSNIYSSLQYFRVECLATDTHYTVCPSTWTQGYPLSSPTLQPPKVGGTEREIVSQQNITSMSSLDSDQCSESVFSQITLKPCGQRERQTLCKFYCSSCSSWSSPAPWELWVHIKDIVHIGRGWILGIQWWWPKEFKKIYCWLIWHATFAL